MGGLSTSLSESGSNLSVGERQLMCLARAVLRNARVLVMDEVTANVDLATDAKIQRAIRRVFVDSTILTIAHRLATIIDADRVLVMQDGRVAELDSPHTLLQRDDTVFAGMVAETGDKASVELRRMAQQAYATAHGHAEVEEEDEEEEEEARAGWEREV